MNRFSLAAASLVAVALVVVTGCDVASSPAPTATPVATPTHAPSPTAGPTPTPEPSPTATPAPTRTPDAGLPLGPFDFEDIRIATTVTIPASGWTFDAAFTALVKGNEVANLPEAAILFWSFPAGTGFYVPGDPCQATSTRPDTPATSVDDLAAALATQASRDASAPVDVTVGGYAGKSIILHVPGDAVSDECELGEFVSYGTEQDPLNRYHQGPGQIDELWILDVDGAFMIIDGMYRPDTPAELIEEMRSIAESATFDTP
ncbi:hypothetical protein BH23CHL7_BH23CHL7_13550 [soil metagenome]